MKNKELIEKRYKVQIKRNQTWDFEPSYLKEFGSCIDRINSVFNTEKMKSRVKNIIGDETQVTLECDTYSLVHIKLMFKTPYFSLTKTLV